MFLCCPECVLGEAVSSPMTVQVVDGDVVVLGPNSVAIALTPAAAEESARRLLAAAALARIDLPPSAEE